MKQIKHIVLSAITWELESESYKRNDTQFIREEEWEMHTWNSIILQNSHY